MQWRGVSILQEKWCRASWASAETVGADQVGCLRCLASPARPHPILSSAAWVSPTLFWLRGSQGGWVGR